MLIRCVSAGRGLQWLTEGFALFRAAPLIWVVDVILFGAVLSFLSLLPIFGSIAATLLQPVLAAGLLQGCRDLVRGEELQIEHLFAGFRVKTKPLLTVGLLLGLATVGLLLVLVAVVLGTGLFGSISLQPAHWSNGLPPVIDRSALIGVLIVVNLALLLSLFLAMAAWFAPALVLFQEVGAWDAMKASFTGCRRNMGAFLIYGVALFLLLLMAVIPFGLGLLIWTPMLFGSIYVSYRDIYGKVP